MTERITVAGYNRVVMIGNLTRDPDYKQLASGQGVCRLGLASNRQYKNRQTGNLVQEVCFVDIDVFGPQAESCNQYLQKGRPVLVEGRLKFDTWETPEGQMRSKHSIIADRVVFLSSQSDQGQAVSMQGASTHTEKKESSPEKEYSDSSEKVNSGEIDFKDEPPFQDDLPF